MQRSHVGLFLCSLLRLLFLNLPLINQLNDIRGGFFYGAAGDVDDGPVVFAEEAAGFAYFFFDGFGVDIAGLFVFVELVQASFADLDEALGRNH